MTMIWWFPRINIQPCWSFLLCEKEKKFDEQTRTAADIHPRTHRGNISLDLAKQSEYLNFKYERVGASHPFLTASAKVIRRVYIYIYNVYIDPSAKHVTRIELVPEKENSLERWKLRNSKEIIALSTLTAFHLLVNIVSLLYRNLLESIITFIDIDDCTVILENFFNQRRYDNETLDLPLLEIEEWFWGKNSIFYFRWSSCNWFRSKTRLETHLVTIAGYFAE